MKETGAPPYAQQARGEGSGVGSGVRYRSQEVERSQTTYAPSVVMLALLSGALTLTLYRPAAIGALLLLALGTALWIRESMRANPALLPGEARRGEPEAAEGRTSLYTVGAAGFAFIQWMALGAAMRVAHAHGLFAPNLARLPTDAGLGLVITGLSVVSAVLAATAAWRAGQADLTRTRLLLFLVAGSAALHLALLLVQAIGFRGDPFFADRAAASALLWVYGLHVAFVGGGLLYAGILLGRAWTAPLRPRHLGAVRAFALFWAATLVSWWVLYVMLYLRLIRIEAQLI